MRTAMNSQVNLLFLCTHNRARSILAEAPRMDLIITVCDNAATTLMQ